MSEVGYLRRWGSRRARQAEHRAARFSSDNPAERLSYDLQIPSQRGDIGRRLDSDEIVIGLALGSPGHSPMPPLPVDDEFVDEIPNNFSLPQYGPSHKGHVREVGAGEPSLTRKGSKWKAFGGLFGRKTSIARAPKASPFYQLDQSPKQGLANQLIAHDQLETNALRRKRADSARTLQEKRGRAGTLQSTTKGESSGLLRRNSSRRKGLRRKMADAEELMPEMRILHSALSAHAAAETQQPPTTNLLLPRPSLLQVQIPNVQLERYSVMFGDVLQGKVQATSRSSSRLQGNSEEPQAAMQPVIEPLAIDMPIPHREDDARSSKSSVGTPSFSLFPATASTPARSKPNRPFPKPSPLSRSATAPSTAFSAPRPTLRANKSQDQDHVFVILHSPEETPSNERKPIPNPTSTSPSSSQASFFECAEDPGDSSAERDSPRSATQLTSRNAFPTRKSSMRKPPPTQYPRHHQVSDSVSTTAEVSIARQVSITRRQRQLLVPIVPKVVQQPVQPTLVEDQNTEVSRQSTHPSLIEA